MAYELPRIFAALNPVAILEYGSGLRDIDLVVVVADGVVRSVRFECFDCLIVSQEEFALRCKWRDIAFTEPVTTGRLVLGAGELLDSLQRLLHSESVSADLLKAYSRLRAQVEFAIARSLFSEWVCAERVAEVKARAQRVLCPAIGSTDNLDVSGRLSNTLAYALSYILSASHYGKLTTVVSFESLRQSTPLLREIRNLHPSRGGGSMSEARRLLSQVRTLLLDTTNPQER